MEKVSVIKCNKYDIKIIENSLKKLLDNYNGIKSFIKPDQRVLLKVNMLMGKPPETMITTNPVLVKAVAKLVKEVGAKPVIGDSPGGPFSKRLLERAYKKTGLATIAKEVGAELNYNIEQKFVPFEQGNYNKSFVLGKFVTDADIIINLPKLKTHGLTMISAAVKNIFGTIPGLLKAEYHLRMPELEHFSQMLVDLVLCVKPVINIMDGIVGMEGEGPSGGKPKEYGYLMASASAPALDVVAAHLIGITPVSKVPTISAAGESGLPSSMEDIKLVGDKLEVVHDTKIPPIVNESNLLDRRLPGFLAKLLAPIMRPRPVFHHDKCIGCGDCYRCCPAEVIHIVDNKPEFDQEDCIRCFCCQELCQYQAISIKRPLLGKILTR